jgi:hypothetical protein
MSKSNGKVSRLSGEEGTAYARQHLIQLKVDSVNWRVLWKDPSTGEYWKEYFPYPDSHGSGPSEFVLITEDKAREDFGAW